MVPISKTRLSVYKSKIKNFFLKGVGSVGYVGKNNVYSIKERKQVRL